MINNEPVPHAKLLVGKGLRKKIRKLLDSAVYCPENKHVWDIIMEKCNYVQPRQDAE
jgi:hypothetical protein